ncbi:SOS response-associated peptidase family protein [Novosphingobium sp. Gsoil 351]|uniref:SOS response-associated peptidase family protein n=1 Tax=Novosphingobium sp. Gsoil 351 TaxID=2675225 RepID=UPI0012B4BC4D|nr:SOS response-associated peptidase family protein [Novosphingobium sp. Gsoil 351]QGN56131.1 hypothetical protein GKE62_17845 [Novosphingobium sp. Gsoil 351]
MTKARGEVARLFKSAIGQVGNAGGEVYPGYPGLVVAGGDLRSMTWGFPLVLKGKTGQPLKPRPVNNTGADKLASFMWRYSFQDRRCLFLVTEFAEAEGEKGAKTRTWFRLPDQGRVRCRGYLEGTPEWGPAYSMIMIETCMNVADVDDRMPVILRPQDWRDWLDGAPDDAAILCRPYPDVMVKEQTTVPWVKRASTEVIYT